jgi:hypothetical protein
MADDMDFADRLLSDSWEHFPADAPISTYQLADILTTVGVDMRDRAGDDPGVLREARRLVDLGGYLNSTPEGGHPEPVVLPRLSLWRRLWLRLRAGGG